MLRKLLSFALLASIILGIPSASPLFTSADARPKKLYRKTKKIVNKVQGKKAARRIRIKKVARKARKTRAAVKRIARRHEEYRLPARTGTIAQNYSLEEGVDEAGADRIVAELKSIGVDDARVNVAKNSLQVKYNTKELSSISVIKKLKELGYTVSRIE